MAGSQSQTLDFRQPLSNLSLWPVASEARGNRVRSVMSTRKRRGGRRHDATGRSTNERFVWLKHWLLNSPAWKSMKPIPRALYVALRKRFNGTNNGQISISVREAATEIRCAKDSAMRALWEL